ILDRAERDVIVLAQAEQAGLNLQDVLAGHRPNRARLGSSAGGHVMAICAFDGAKLIAVEVAHVHPRLEPSEVSLLFHLRYTSSGECVLRPAQCVPIQFKCFRVSQSAPAGASPGLLALDLACGTPLSRPSYLQRL